MFEFALLSLNKWKVNNNFKYAVNMINANNSANQMLHWGQICKVNLAPNSRC